MQEKKFPLDVKTVSWNWQYDKLISGGRFLTAQRVKDWFFNKLDNKSYRNSLAC